MPMLNRNATAHIGHTRMLPVWPRRWDNGYLLNLNLLVPWNSTERVSRKPPSSSSSGCTLNSHECYPLAGSPILLKRQQKRALPLLIHAWNWLIITPTPTQWAHRGPGLGWGGADIRLWLISSPALCLSVLMYQVFIGPFRNVMLKGKTVDSFRVSLVKEGALMLPERSCFQLIVRCKRCGWWICVSMQTRLMWRWPQTTATPRERWFSASRYETTTPPGTWLRWWGLMLRNHAGNFTSASV